MCRMLVILFIYFEVGAAFCRNLRQMGYGRHLNVLCYILHHKAHAVGHIAGYSGVHFVKYY